MAGLAVRFPEARNRKETESGLIAMAMLMVMTLDCSLDPHVSEACRSATQPKTQMLMVMTMAKQRQPLFCRSIYTSEACNENRC